MSEQADLSWPSLKVSDVIEDLTKLQAVDNEGKIIFLEFFSLLYVLYLGFLMTVFVWTECFKNALSHEVIVL